MGTFYGGGGWVGGGGWLELGDGIFVSVVGWTFFMGRQEWVHFLCVCRGGGDIFWVGGGGWTFFMGGWDWVVEGGGKWGWSLVLV